VYAGPAIACKVSDTFSAGFSVGLGQGGTGCKGLHVRAPNDIVALIDILGEVTEGLEIPVVSELTLPSPWFGGGLPTYGDLARLDFDLMDDFTTSFNVGFLWKPRDWFSFGACYQSSSRSKLKGHYNFKYSEEWQNFVNWFGSSPTTATVAGIFDLPYKAVPQQTGTVYQKKWLWPQRVQCGIMLRPFKRLRLMCDFHWTDWTCADKDSFVFDQDIQILKVAKLLGYTGGNRVLVLERHWKKTQHFSFGAEFQLFDWLSLRAGYEPRPTSVPKKYYDLTWPVQDWKIYTCGWGSG
jgi:Long-chain fatty acid transport protein